MNIFNTYKDYIMNTIKARHKQGTSKLWFYIKQIVHISTIILTMYWLTMLFLFCGLIGLYSMAYILGLSLVIGAAYIFYLGIKAIYNQLMS